MRDSYQYDLSLSVRPIDNRLWREIAILAYQSIHTFPQIGIDYFFWNVDRHGYSKQALGYSR